MSGGDGNGGDGEVFLSLLSGGGGVMVVYCWE